MGNLCDFSKNKSPPQTQQIQQKELPSVSDKEKTVFKMKVAQDKLLEKKRGIQKNSDKAFEEAKAFAA
jgi:hypothetical protein